MGEDATKDDTTQTTQTTQTTGNGSDGAGAKSTRMFSQDELNAIVQDRVKTYKTTIDTLTADKGVLEGKLSDVTSKFNSLEQSNSLRQLGVSEDFMDFVMFKAEKLAVNGKSITDAIKEVVDGNKAMLGIKDDDETSDDSKGDSTKSGKSTTGKSTDEKSKEGNTDNKSGGTDDDDKSKKRSSTKVERGASKGDANSSDSDVDAFLKRKGLVK